MMIWGGCSYMISATLQIPDKKEIVQCSDQVAAANHSEKVQWMEDIAETVQVFFMIIITFINIIVVVFIITFMKDIAETVKNIIVFSVTLWPQYARERGLDSSPTANKYIDNYLVYNYFFYNYFVDNICLQ